MSDKNLAGKALQAIYLFWKNHNHTYPTSSEISRALGLSSASWGNLRNRMIGNGLLKPSRVWGIEFTNETFQIVRENENREKIENLPVPYNDKKGKTIEDSTNKVVTDISLDLESMFNYVEVRLFGAVKAGLGGREDDLELYAGDETISVPDQIGDPSKYFALQVKGESMVHENIFPGNFVIVKKVEFGEIKEQDLVVVKYLDNKYFNKKTDELEMLIQNREFLGPTLKYYTRLRRGDKRVSYRLSWKTEAEESEFRIDTPHIALDEIGLVAAVYSPEQFRIIKKSK
jgi:SOS-response transcriptional repressor LexA